MSFSVRIFGAFSKLEPFDCVALPSPPPQACFFALFHWRHTLWLLNWCVHGWMFARSMDLEAESNWLLHCTCMYICYTVLLWTVINICCIYLLQIMKWLVSEYSQDLISSPLIYSISYNRQLSWQHTHYTSTHACTHACNHARMHAHTHAHTHFIHLHAQSVHTACTIQRITIEINSFYWR